MKDKAGGIVESWQLKVRNIMRKRLFDSGVIDPDRVQLPNTIFERPTSGVWLRESVNEGTEAVFTNRHTSQLTIVNYEVFGALALGADAVDDTIEKIRAAFPIVGTDAVLLEADGMFAVVTQLDKPTGGVDPVDPTWYRRLVAITVNALIAAND